ncbi:unnamed protein product [Leptosia nina]|uniref:Uncharacterized protein n=1 Tax=Leptosia nina TaxID=320188 RepID=A0AAV1J6E0_9NEOP
MGSAWLLVGVIFVLSLIDTHAFTINRSDLADLDSQESIKLEVRPNDIEITKNGFLHTTETNTKDVESFRDVTASDNDASQSFPEINPENIDTTDNNDVYNGASTINDESNFSRYNEYTHISYNLASSEANQVPSWKKYTLINRKSLSEELYDNDNTTEIERMKTDETSLPRQESKSDIPSLNQIKNFLFPSSFFKSDVQNDTATSSEVTEQVTSDKEDSTLKITSDKSAPAAVESKRGGFLDFSLKSLFEDNSDKKDNSQENTTSKPKGRRLSWRFGSRYRGKEDSSAEKEKEKSRFRLRNKDRKKDNNNTKESKENSKEVDSREETERLSSQAVTDISREMKQIDEVGTKVDRIDESKISSGNKDKAESKEVKQPRVENVNNNVKEQFEFTRVNDRSKQKEESDRTAYTKSTTDIGIWKTESTVTTSPYSKDSKTRSDGNKLKEDNDKSSLYQNNRENSKERNKSDKETYKNENNKQRKEKSDDREIKRNEKYNLKIFDKKEKEEPLNLDGERNNKSKEYISKNDNIETISGYQEHAKTFTETKVIKEQESNSQLNLKQEVNNEPFNDFDTDNKTTKLQEFPNNTEQKTQTGETGSIPNDQNSQKPLNIEYIKQYLSTIDEEEESEPPPSADHFETTTIEPKLLEMQNSVTAGYPPDILDTTPSISEPYGPYKIPNLLITLPSPKNKSEKYYPSVEKSDEQYRSHEGMYQQLESTTVENSNENIGTFDDKNYSSINNNKVKQTEAVVQMHEDARKEELLKEEVINNYEENFERYKEIKTTTQSIIPVKIYEVNKKLDDKENTTLNDEKLSVKPLSFLDKLKTTILYPVGANYKAPKKIEVQPPKIFVRDPDDNSWRNESLSSLGIVFKPKNSSKPFTQVLKNKTETEWNNLIEKQNKNETPDLRERLEKIAEIRKNKKKKTDAYGNVIYNDYDEINSKETEYSKDIPSSTVPAIIPPTSTTTAQPPSVYTSTLETVTKPEQPSVSKSTEKPKPKKVFNVAEYYDTSDEDDADYLTLAKIDLKKFTVPGKSNGYVPPSWPVTNVRYEKHPDYDRKPTLQYFPPLTTQKGMFKDYDNGFQKKMGVYTDTEPPTNVLPVSYTKHTTSLPKMSDTHMFTPHFRSPVEPLTTRAMQYEKDAYMTQAPVSPGERDEYTVVTDDGSYNRAADVIKHYRDFLSAVARDQEEDKNVEYDPPYTEGPRQGVTKSEVMINQKFKAQAEVENYDEETDFRKDVLQRFVHNFNQNSERFKSDLPLLYNNSIIHGSHGEGKEVASSRAYLSRMLTRPSGDCDNNSTVELSPAYELHYYVPEQEEKEEVDPKAASQPYRYRL